jgi:hypothetical protein
MGAFVSVNLGIMNLIVAVIWGCQSAISRRFPCAQGALSKEGELPSPLLIKHTHPSTTTKTVFGNCWYDNYQNSCLKFGKHTVPPEETLYSQAGGISCFHFAGPGTWVLTPKWRQGPEPCPDARHLGTQLLALK